MTQSNGLEPTGCEERWLREKKITSRGFKVEGLTAKTYHVVEGR